MSLVPRGGTILTRKAIVGLLAVTLVWSIAVWSAWRWKGSDDLVRAVVILGTTFSVLLPSLVTLLFERQRRAGGR